MTARFARLSLLLLLAAAALQLATVTAVAAIGAHTKPAQPEVPSVALLIDSLRLEKQYDVPDVNIDWDGLFRRCGIEPDALGRGDDNVVNQGPWSPYSARGLLSAQLQMEESRWERRAIGWRLEQTTSDFERRFLIGCIHGTVFAPLCRTRAASLVDAANKQGPLPDAERRLDWYYQWNAKTMCVFMRGAARELAEGKK